jgi:hypothetical protein
VDLRSEQTNWRYQLAVLLKHQGRIDEAHDQAKTCVHLAPANQTYRGLLREIVRMILLKGHSSAQDSEKPLQDMPRLPAGTAADGAAPPLAAG